MNRFIELIKKIFFKKKLLLNEAKISTDNGCSNNKEVFFNSIKAENCENNLFLTQKNLENGFIDESKLSNEEVVKIKKLYCNQILDLMESINNYKLKLN